MTGTVLFKSSVARAKLYNTVTNNYRFRYTTLCVKFHYVQWNSATPGNTVYKLSLVVWREAVWHEVALQ
jgi:hypothetical protein